MAEAVGLVNTLDNWTVVDQLILSTKTPEKKRIFGKGNFQYLTGDVTSPQFRAAVSHTCMCVIMCSLAEKIRQTGGITAVFVNVERLSALSEVSSSEVHRCSATNVDSSFFGFRESLRKPGGSKSLTGIQWSSIFFAATPRPRRPSCRSHWQRSPC